MMRTSVFAFMAVAFAAGSLPADARPQGYYPQQQTPPAYAPAPRGSSGIRLNIPWAQWNNDVPPPRAAMQNRMARSADARTWYVPAPDGEVRQYASYSAQPNAYYYPQDPAPQQTYQRQASQQAPSYYQPDANEPAWRAQERAQNGGRVDPRFQRTLVNYTGRESPGTIVIDTNLRYLFLVQNDGTAVRYGIGVGRPGFEWAGVKSITRKAEWPDWTPPDEMVKRRPDLPRFMPGGPGNPLGARAMYLGSSLYRIHGTNEPETIGKAVSSGCIRMVNEDVTDLYQRVRVGTRVIVI